MLGSEEFGLSFQRGGDDRRPTMDAWERQQVFGEVVVLELRNGRLSTLRRKRLVQYAATLDISATLAGRLIEQARKRVAESRDESSTAASLRCAQSDGAATPSAESRKWLWIGLGLLILAVCLFQGRSAW